MIDYICYVHVRMETGSAEVQPGECQNHERTENEVGQKPCPTYLKQLSFLRQEKTKKT